MPSKNVSTGFARKSKNRLISPKSVKTICGYGILSVKKAVERGYIDEEDTKCGICDLKGCRVMLDDDVVDTVLCKECYKEFVDADLSL